MRLRPVPACRGGGARVLQAAEMLQATTIRTALCCCVGIVRVERGKGCEAPLHTSAQSQLSKTSTTPFYSQLPPTHLHPVHTPHLERSEYAAALASSG